MRTRTRRTTAATGAAPATTRSRTRKPAADTDAAPDPVPETTVGE
ncbi:hypothetical protein A6302_04347 [Methylobrevis pamukkalensis]|uniref:Uncharacterized protein n=1 Tax=Methylobrevis pamukkalensis TaxID=1439726 RepID=A0A1E3GVP7_9HYPH|nr:hypothetical protein A6302_04347 [Methylobrevis pamukkalensis]